MEDNQNEKIDSAIVEGVDEIEIFHLDDPRLKIFLEELSNDTSRSILKTVFEGKRTASDIAVCLNLSVSLVVYHLGRLIQTDIIKISGSEINSKNRKMKLYDSKKNAIVIRLNQNSETLRKIKNSFILSISIAIMGTISTVLQLFDSQNTVLLTLEDLDTTTHLPPITYFPVILSGIITVIAIGIAIWLKKK